MKTTIAESRKKSNIFHTSLTKESHDSTDRYNYRHSSVRWSANQTATMRQPL